MATKDERTGFWRVKCAPDHPVIATGITDRALGRMMSATLTSEPQSKAEEDLVGDAFFSLWRNNPKTVENPRPDRAVNKLLMDWVLSTPDFQQARASAVGNLPASLASAGFLWSSLTTEKALQDALDKQRQAEAKEDEADQHYQDMAKAMQDGNQKSAEKHKQAAEKAHQEAQELAQQAQSAIQKMQNNPLAQGMIKQAVKEAGEKGEEVAAIMDGWGIGEGDVSMEDATELVNLAIQASDTFKRLGELIGRFEKIAAKTSENTRKEYTGAVSEPTLTNDINRLFPTERAYLSQLAPPYLRAQYVARLFAGGGLLGWRPKAEGKRKGSFVGMIDRSGSMYGGELDTAKAIALGIGRALLEDQGMVERKYQMAYFDDSVNNIVVDSDDSWQKHVEWASVNSAGGTDFNDALNYAIATIEQFKKDGVSGADILFITDGEAGVSDETVLRLNKLKEDVGTRLLLVLIGGSGGHYRGYRNYSDITDLADTVIRVNSTDFQNNAEKIVAELTEQIVKAEFD